MRARHLLAVAGFILLLGNACSINAVQQKRDYLQNVEFRLREVNLRINELEHLHAETLQSGMSSSPELAETLDDLDQKQDTAMQRFTEMKKAGIATWKGVRYSMDEALQNLERSCDIATFMLEQAWLETQEQGTSTRYLLISFPSKAENDTPANLAEVSL